MDMLVMPEDCYGAYYPNLGKVESAVRKNTKLTLITLADHFWGRPYRAAGLHPICVVKEDDQTRSEAGWGVVDIDWHESDEPPPPQNEATAIVWFNALKDRGYSSALEDSNGNGGFHLWMLVDPVAPVWVVNAFLRRLTADWRTHGLRGEPELTPTSNEESPFGVWVRLPGRHPKRIEHWSRFYDGTRFVEGDAAINLFTSLKPIELFEDELADLAGWRVPIVSAARDRSRQNQIMVPESPGGPGSDLQSLNRMALP
jgi:hypothetical protein